MAAGQQKKRLNGANSLRFSLHDSMRIKKPKKVASLCAGNLHPDTVLHKEYQLRACRKAYFVELKKYHSGFIEGLSMLKERWANCGNPDKDTENNILRSSVENPTPPVAIEKELQEIDLENGGSKYMSYIKINKKQYRLVMNIRNSDNGIDSECLSEILGDINGFDVKPYAALEEEERKRLQDHWVKLANEDLPAAFENRGRHRALINNLKKLMHRELTMKEPVARRIEDERIKRKEEKEKLKWTTPLEQADDIASEQEFVHETQDEGHIQQVYHHFTDCQHLDRISLLNTSNELDLESIVEHRTSPSTVGHHQERNPSLDHHMELSVDFPQGVQDEIRPGGPVAWQFLGSMTASGDAVEAKLKHSTSFPTGHSYGHPTMERQRDTPTGDLPLHRPQLMEERTSPSLDLETQILRQEEAESVALHDNNRETMFGRYADQDRCPLQAAFQKEHVSLRSDVPEHLNRLEPSELRLSLANVAQFPSQFEEQQLMLLDLEQPGEKDPYMPQILNRDAVSRGGQSQESTGLQSAVIGGFSGQRWLPLEHRSCAGLSTAKPAGRAGQCMGGGSSADGSLFCVLSECNKLLSGFPQATTDSDHFPQGANIVGGGGLHQEGIYSSPPLLDSTGGRNGAAVWTNYPNQRSELSESVRKSYLPSWH
ncbi:unnamed protein product [Spirodela intermedia]|uniref:Uncharacterized protein n=1 Tax=Spirodela intermedia TaxID=51605 RepID=A0A7I8ISY6_SPIIN|nr:unnamed protein product [Spirodela intermedia]CAA6660064.1 unnamed protein product [Spirodela intermedia]